MLDTWVSDGERTCEMGNEMCDMLRGKSSLKMGLLIFPEHVGNTDICVGGVVTVKIAIYYISFLFSLQKFLANLELFKITDLQNIGEGGVFP